MSHVIKMIGIISTNRFSNISSYINKVVITFHWSMSIFVGRGRCSWEIDLYLIKHISYVPRILI